MRILWSPQSLRDLDAIHEYIAKDSEHYAGLTIARIFSAVDICSSSRARDALCRSETSLKFAKSSLDVFAWCTEFKISGLKSQLFSGQQGNSQKNSREWDGVVPSKSCSEPVEWAPRYTIEESQCRVLLLQNDLFLKYQ
jgi:hypothetical protein